MNSIHNANLTIRNLWSFLKTTFLTGMAFFALLFMVAKATAQTATCTTLAQPMTPMTSLIPTGVRPFAMGFVHFPHTLSTECGHPLDINLHYVKNFGDLMVIHEDGGVPFGYAIQKWFNPSLQAFPTQYPIGYQNEIRELMSRRRQLPATHKVALYTNYMNFMKTAIADNRTADPVTGKPVLTPWPRESRYLFNNDYFVFGYLAHITYLIDLYQPDFIGYGIENNLFLTRLVDTAFTPDPSDDIPYQAWKDYETASARIYSYLKQRYPSKFVYFSQAIDDYNYPGTWDFGANLPLYNLLTQAIVHTGSQALATRYLTREVWQREHLKRAIQFSDLVAISTYPYMGGYPDPTKIPADYFRRIRAIAPDKRFAIAETGFQAEPYVFPDPLPAGTTPELYIEGSASFQASYISRIINEATSQNALFLNWFVVRDYDGLWKELSNQPDAKINRIWRDNGIFDGNGYQRLSGLIWQIQKWKPRAY